MVAPIVEKIANEYSGRIKVVKLNTDENQEIAYRYGIKSIPIIGIFSNGKVVDAIIGAVPKNFLESKITPHLGVVN